MFRKILYPTDFSESSDRAIPYILKLKEAGTREIVLLHVIDVRYGGMVEAVTWFGETVQQFEMELYNKLKQDSEKRLEMIRKKLSRHYKIKVIIQNGIPFKVIIDTAEEEKVSLIVLGSHGKSNIEEMLLGSVSEKVIRKSAKPCLVIKR